MRTLRSVVALLMAFVVTTATAGVPLGQHFCRGERQGLRLFALPDTCAHGGKEAACHAQAKTPPCHQTEASADPADCCTTNFSLIKLIKADAFTAKAANVLTMAPTWVAAWPVLLTYLWGWCPLPLRVVVQADEAPPLRLRDLPVLFHAFLI